MRRCCDRVKAHVRTRAPPAIPSLPARSVSLPGPPLDMHLSAQNSHPALWDPCPKHAGLDGLVALRVGHLQRDLDLSFRLGLNHLLRAEAFSAAPPSSLSVAPLPLLCDAEHSRDQMTAARSSTMLGWGRCGAGGEHPLLFAERCDAAEVTLGNAQVVHTHVFDQPASQA
jgi:hypothetical protein